jgi:hypothetical protein
MKPTLTVWMALPATLAALVVGSHPAAMKLAVVRTVYFSAVDADGAHVTDLTAADLTVKEGGKDRAIDAVKPATVPMQVSFLVDDGSTGGFQAVVGQFIKATFERAEFTIRALNPQAIKVVEFTRNGDDLREALGRIGRRGRVPNDGEQIIAGVMDAAKELQERRARRGVIIALTVTGEKPLADGADDAMKALRGSGASLSVIYVTGVQLGRVLGDGPTQSGGTIEQASGTIALGPAMTRVINNLLNQYVLTYTIPDGVKLSDRLSVSTSRKNVKLLAPTWLRDQ